jgi:hypothetical protein
MRHTCGQRPRSQDGSYLLLLIFLSNKASETGRLEESGGLCEAEEIKVGLLSGLNCHDLVDVLLYL